MTTAIPICHHRISPLLDSAARLLLVDHQHGKVLKRREVVLEAGSPEFLAARIAELSVNVLLCAAVSGLLRDRLRQNGIRVRSRLCGNVDEILDAFFSRRLGRRCFRMPGGWNPDASRSQPRRGRARSEHSPHEATLSPPRNRFGRIGRRPKPD